MSGVWGDFCNTTTAGRLAVFSLISERPVLLQKVFRLRISAFATGPPVLPYKKDRKSRKTSFPSSCINWKEHTFHFQHTLDIMLFKFAIPTVFVTVLLYTLVGTVAGVPQGGIIIPCKGPGDSALPVISAAITQEFGPGSGLPLGFFLRLLSGYNDTEPSLCLNPNTTELSPELSPVVEPTIRAAFRDFLEQFSQVHHVRVLSKVVEVNVNVRLSPDVFNEKKRNQPNSAACPEARIIARISTTSTLHAALLYSFYHVV
ncbi:hypothetical protein J3R30DRAFT_3687940 [Lentinula aciculospora]|uniref:Uncharacterized protein n=1 Tax=Lentinula aciculospora TaxID=153920 RepID=A0A9W9DFR5_9AGAR|nr:hypothetical protein J3R30DRAFT_3687940 [Lentinula aciculospora]